MKVQEAYDNICLKLRSQIMGSFSEPNEAHYFEKAVSTECLHYPIEIQNRLLQEFIGLGPLELLIEDPQITEILVNSPKSIWYEIDGKLRQHDDFFLSEKSFENVVDRIVHLSGQNISIDKPYVESQFRGMRLTVISHFLTEKYAQVSMRKQPKTSWTLERLKTQNWCSQPVQKYLESLIQNRSHILVIGETGSGKTSIMNALINCVASTERCLVIEDSSEIRVPNEVSLKLLTRPGLKGQFESVQQHDLIKRALRLRPDRLIMGEIRGEEAKDFLMLLATGHEGSMATLHAKDAQEALLRLEMLVQLGAPQWNLESIRKLIFLSLQYVLITKRDSNGSRKFNGIYKLSSLEESGLTVERVDLNSRLGGNST